MGILIIDTSSDEGLLALVVEGHIAAEVRLSNGPGLSKALSLELKKMVDRKPTSIVAGTGPGSFTGIRVGLALAQGLALGWEIPLLKVCSLSGFREEIVAIDARSSGFYVRFGGAPPRLLSVHEAETALAGLDVFSPHPSRILERLPSLRPQQATLDPLMFLKKSVESLRMNTPSNQP